MGNWTLRVVSWSALATSTLFECPNKQADQSRQIDGFCTDLKRALPAMDNARNPVLHSLDLDR